jgi:hypothetical protein
MTPESVTPGVLFLVSENAPSRVILGAGTGVFAVTHIGETHGVYLDESERTPETIAARFAEISGGPAEALKDAFSQTYKFVAAAAKRRSQAGVRMQNTATTLRVSPVRRGGIYPSPFSSSASQRPQASALRMPAGVMGSCAAPS